MTHKCADPNCPGEPYKASDIPHRHHPQEATGDLEAAALAYLHHTGHYEVTREEVKHYEGALRAVRAILAAYGNAWEVDYEAAYQAHEEAVERMAGTRHALNDEGKAMVRAIVNAALAGRKR